MKIKGYTNTWSVIDRREIVTEKYIGQVYLMENDEYGDETCLLLVDKDYNVLIETYDDIETALEDMGW